MQNRILDNDLLLKNKIFIDIYEHLIEINLKNMCRKRKSAILYITPKN